MKHPRTKEERLRRDYRRWVVALVVIAVPAAALDIWRHSWFLAAWEISAFVFCVWVFRRVTRRHPLCPDCGHFLDASHYGVSPEGTFGWLLCAVEDCECWSPIGRIHEGLELHTHSEVMERIAQWVERTGKPAK